MERPAILEDVSPGSLADAAARSLQALNRFLGRSPRTEVSEAAGLYRWRTAIPHPYFSGVIAAAPPDADAPSRVREAIAAFESSGTEAFSWWLVPGVPAAPWKPLLVAHGFEHVPELPGMALALGDLEAEAGAGSRDPRSDGVEIHRVETRAMRRAWAETFVAGNEYREAMASPLFDVYDDLHGPDAPLVSYLAFANGVPVATGSVFYAAGVAGLYDIATLPGSRGRGFGSAVTRALLLAARDRGYRVAVLQSSPKGLRVYERFGFRTVGTIEHFVRGPGP